MPKAIALTDETPRRRGSTALEALSGRNILLRIVLGHPKDIVAGALAFAAVSAIVANAMFLQAGRHPSPMFGSSTVVPFAVSSSPNPLPRPRPLEAATRPVDSKALDARLLDSKPVDGKVVDAKADAKGADSANSPAKPSALPVGPVAAARPPAPMAAATRSDPLGDLILSSRRVASVQRALTEYGYGQLKPTGTVGSDTQAAIQRFERERKLPVTGQMSDRLVRELATVTGRPIN